LPWNLLRVRAPDAWRRGTGAADVVIGIVDGRPDVQHPALAERLLLPLGAALMFCEGDPPVSHATNVASVVGAADERARGLAPGLRILPLVVDLRAQRYAERADAISFAAQAARRHDVEGHAFRRLVLCCSWRTAGDIAVVRNAVEEAVAAGVLLVFSAGNDGNELAHFPSDYSRSERFGEGVISVAATTEADHLASFSNYGPNVDLCAPGGDGLPIDERDVLCADQAGSYAFAAGTSIAAPHVAACAGLLLSLDATLSPARLKRVLKESAQSIDAANPHLFQKLGSGRLDAAAAIERVLAASAPAPGGEEAPSPPAAGPISRMALVELEALEGPISPGEAVKAAREALALRMAASEASPSAFRIVEATLRGPGARVVLFVEP
jgi:subtilisin family serine protease